MDADAVMEQAQKESGRVVTMFGVMRWLENGDAEPAAGWMDGVSQLRRDARTGELRLTSDFPGSEHEPVFTREPYQNAAALPGSPHERRACQPGRGRTSLPGPIPPSQRDPELLAFVQRASLNDGNPLNFFLAMACYPALLMKWTWFAAHLLGRGPTGPARRELLIRGPPGTAVRATSGSTTRAAPVRATSPPARSPPSGMALAWPCGTSASGRCRPRRTNCTPTR